MTTYQENAIATNPDTEESVKEPYVIEVDFGTDESIDPSERTVRSGLVFDVVEEDEPKEMLEPDPEVAEAARRINEERPVYRFVKRASDILLSAAILILFSWLYAIIAIIIKIDDPKGPVIFSQERVGKDGVPFKMYKFRTMVVDAEDRLEELKELNEKTGPVFKMSRDPRLLRSGIWLRRLSLDELPQFVNVLKGEISVVGPRPALIREAVLYTPRQKQRLLVKPGITCYWQTRFDRDHITFDEWVELDLLYIMKCGVGADFRQIVKTVLVVLTAQGN